MHWLCVAGCPISCVFYEIGILFANFVNKTLKTKKMLSHFKCKVKMYEYFQLFAPNLVYCIIMTDFQVTHDCGSIKVHDQWLSISISNCR